jgi:hypothetical protein
VTAYEDPVGTLRFLFEVENLSDHPVERARAEVVLLDARGNVVASRSGYARLDLLPPGETAAVLVTFFLSTPEFASYRIRVHGHRADYLAEQLHSSLQIVDHSVRVGEWVPYEVLGEVQNTGDVDAEAVTLAVTCYGDDGGVVAVSSGSPSDRTIPAGGSSPFLISIGTGAAALNTCKVQVEGLASGGD